MTRTVVVVPHPDDEVLSTTGLICTQIAAGCDVLVVAVTDGEAAYENVPRLAEIRRAEQIEALAELGIAEGSIHRLGLPDGQIRQQHTRLVLDLLALIDADTLVVAPWVGDHHCDHEAVGRAAVDACRQSGAALLFGLFWTWQHSSPDEFGDRLITEIKLDEVTRNRRYRALGHHRSQVTTAVSSEPVLQPNDLSPMRWSSEYFIHPLSSDTP